MTSRICSLTLATTRSYGPMFPRQLAALQVPPTGRRLSGGEPRGCLRQLTTDVEEVVADLMEGVHSYPSQSSHGRLRVVVRDVAVPVRRSQAVEDIAEQLCRVAELARHVGRLLICVAVMIDSFVAAHGLTPGPVHATAGEHPLALDQQDVS